LWHFVAVALCYVNFIVWNFIAVVFCLYPPSSHIWFSKF